MSTDLQISVEELDEQLKNPAWHAFRGVLSRFATVDEDGLVFRADHRVTPFWAIDQPTPEAWAAVAGVAGDDGVAVFMRADEPVVPDGARLLFHEIGEQYLAVDVGDPPELDLVELGAADSAEMVALARLTEPGPFAGRTHELGRYLGVRRDGELIAMAGERLQSDLFSEISGVCVHPDHRRNGLAAVLTQVMVREIEGRGKAAMLHVRDGNEAAAALYRKLGFEFTRSMSFSAVGFRPS